MDRRKNYYLIVDTETANTNDDNMNDPLVYDIGGAIVDKKGKVYETFSFIIYEIFFGMQDIMNSAYYADKIPMYKEEINNGTRKIVTYFSAKRYIKELCHKWNVKAIIAHNMFFDYKATNQTQRYLTKSKYRYFFPYGIELWDTMKMAHDTICKQKSYINWCKENGFMTKHRKPRPQEKAETIYRYLIGDTNFIESHTGLEDVMIEKEIFAHCNRQHKKMRRKLFNK